MDDALLPGGNGAWHRGHAGGARGTAPAHQRPAAATGAGHIPPGRPELPLHSQASKGERTLSPSTLVSELQNRVELYLTCVQMRPPGHLPEYLLDQEGL